MPKISLKSFLFLVLFVWSASFVSGQVARFTVDDTAGCAPLVVHFTNTSTGATSYSWNLGEGTILPLTDVSTAYTTPGTYTVTLTAISGASSSTYSTIIRVYSAPTVSFYASDTSVCPGTPVIFTSTSTSGAWGGITYTWNFGDGGSSTMSSPTYSYVSPGFYNIILYATNSKGCVSSRTMTSYMHAFTPAAVGFGVSSATFCKPPAAAVFSNTTTGTSPFSYVWRFGDGVTSSTPSPPHTYTAAGSYNVTLKVTDGNGCIDSLVRPGYIVVGSLSSSYTSVSSACANTPIAFINTSSAHISSQWIFADGGTSTAESAIHTYTASGTYNVKLVVYNGGTCYDTATHTINIIASPTGSFTITPPAPCPPPTTLTLTASVSAGTTVSWLFGDGTTGSGTPVTHSYPYSKIYVIDMIMTGSTGCKDTIERYDTLYNLRLSTASTVPIAGCVPLSVNFSSYDYSVVYNPFTHDSMYLSYPYPITSYTWRFGDGSPNSSSPTPLHTYTAIGVFTANCTVTTSNGCSATALSTISVGTPPVPSFTASPRHVCADRTTTFVSTSVGTIDNYIWQFGDGGEVSGPGLSTVTHIDSVPGLHRVTLYAYFRDCPAILPFSLVDSVDSPKATINYNYTCIPNNGIAFTDGSLGDNSHLWMFGDGVTSTLSNPTHYYPSLSPFVVKLATYNIASGCRDTATTSIPLAPPLVNFYTLDSVRICRDKIDTFYSLIGGTTALNYRWYDNGSVVDSTHATLMENFHVRGLHTMMLVIKDSRMCFDTFTRNNYILVAKPIDSFSFTPLAGCAPVSINFTDRSTDVATISITRYFWSFGDGDTTSTTIPTISHNYTANGIYPIKEIVRDNLGCMDTMNVSTISISKPLAGFITTGTVYCTNTSVHFTNTSTGYTSSSWSFGDGAVSTVSSPTHVYSTAGVYTVRLIVFSSIGCRDTLTYLNYITVNPSPVASFYMDDSFAVCPPLNVSFFNTSTGATSYYWSLGDGTHSVAASPGDIYVTPAIYTIKLAAINSYGCSDTAIGHAKIFGYSGAFTYTPLSGCSPLAVHFGATLTSATSIIWDFRDGVTVLSTSDTITHTYHAAGAYVPKLILTDSSGCTSFSDGADTIKVDSVIAHFNTTPGCINSSTVFHDASTSYFSGVTSWLWSFGSGATSTLSAPAYTYTTSGSHSVTLTVVNAHGCSSTVTQNVTVSPAPPPITGLFTVCAGSVTTLGDATSGGTWSSSLPSIATVGSTSGTVTGLARGATAITYTAPGTGCTTTTTVNVYPAPGAITGPSSVCSGLTITLADTTAGGVWTSSSATIGSVGSSSGIVTGGSVGVATITYAFTSTCFVTKIVTVGATPAAITGPSVVCIGLTINDSDIVPGGTWSSSSTAAATVGSLTGIVTGVASGVTTITYSTGGSCYAIKRTTVNPSPAGILGVTAVCESSTTTLSDVTPGGVWSSSAYGIASVVSSGVVTGLLAGTATISYTVAGCAATIMVTVSPSPSAISGPSTVCAGATIPETNTVSGGTWTSSDPLLATVGSSSGIVTGTGGGTVTISYSLGAGCLRTRLIIVNPISPITGVTALCAGNTSALSDATAGGAWTSSNTSVATIVSGTGFLTSIAPGATTITYSLTTGCTASVTVSVSLAPAPIGGTLRVCLGSTATLLDGGGGTWTSAASGIATVGSSSGIIGGVSLGSTRITYSLGSGCTTDTVITVIPSPGAITGTPKVCVSATTTVGDPTPGGAWSASGAGIATIGSATGVITGLAAGRENITYTTTSGCIAYIAATVYPLPASITGNLSICIGSLSPLSDSTPGGTWSSSSLAIATVISSTGVASGAGIGTATITYTLLTGCFAHTTLSVNSSPGAITGATHLCIGDTIMLTDAGGGTWSSSNLTVATIGSASGIVSGVSAGVSRITYSLGSTCISNLIITVNPLPSIITGPSEVCQRAIITLSDSASGGLWTSGSTGIATIVSATGLLTGVAAGTSSITYTLTTGCRRSMPATVNPSPPPITGITHVCIGQSTILRDAGPGGIWGTSDASIASVLPTGEVLGLIPGTATITYSQGGCPATTTVTVNPLPGPVLGSTFICKDLPYSFTDATAGGTWSSPTGAGTVIVTGTGIVTGTALGSAVITYTLPTGCIATATVTVNPVPPAITGLAPMCAGHSIVLSDPIPGGTWTSGDMAIATVFPIGASALVTGVSGGAAPISYIFDGCPAIALVVVNPLPGPILDAANICAYGGTVRVRDSVSGGFWSSSLATVDSFGVVTGAAQGTARITYTLYTGCFVTDSITVYPTPAVITGDPHACVGLTTTLTDITPGCIWTSSATGIARVLGGVVTGVSTGLATISYSYPVTGCKQTIVVTVSPLPSPIGGSPKVCAGSSTTLTDTTAGGVWSSSNTAIASADAVAGMITGMSAGTATITYYLAAGCSVLRTFTVNPLPALYAITGGGNYCSGTGGVHIGLSGSDPGVTYTLFHDATLTGTITGTGSIADFGLETLAGTYKVFADNTITTCNDNMPDSVIVTIIPSVIAAVSITASPGNIVCAGTPVTYLATPVNGGSAPAYQWAVNGSAAGAGGPSYSYTPSDNDVVSTQLTSNAVCAVPDTVSSAVTMTVVTPVAPAVTINAEPGSSVLPGTIVTLTAVVTGGGTSPLYQWYVNADPVGGATTASFTNTFANHDSVSCRVTADGVCNAVGDGWVIMIVGNGGVSVKNIILEGGIVIIPNPSKGEFVIKGSLGATSEEVLLEISDLLGQVVYTNKVMTMNGKLDEHIHLKNTLANGMYILNLNGASGNKVFHIVIER